MGVKTKTINAGRVGITPKGDWSSTYKSGHGYDLLDAVFHSYDSWLSTENANTDEPTDESTKWQRLTKGGKRAQEQGDYAKYEGDYAKDQGDLAKAEGNRAKGYNDHPWEIRDDGYIYVWDETTQTMVKTNKMIISFEDLTEEQKQELIDLFFEELVFDEAPTAGSPNPVTSRGVKTAIDNEARERIDGLNTKQDKLTFASVEVCKAIIDELI